MAEIHVQAKKELLLHLVMDTCVFNNYRCSSSVYIDA
jgi:hypothetical protein